MNHIRLALRARVPLSIAAIVFAGLGLLASHFGLSAANGQFDGLPATHPLTGLCLLGLGGAVLATRRLGPGPLWQTAVLGGIVAICAARIMDLVLAATTGAAPAALFGPIGGFSGVFSYEAAITLGAFAAAVLTRQDKSRWGGAFLAVGLAMVFASLLQFSYGLTLLSGQLSTFTFMAELAVAGAVLSIYVHRPYVRAVFMPGPYGGQVRRMATAIVMVPWAAGLAVVMVNEAVEAQLAVSGLTAVITCAMMILLLTGSSRAETPAPVVGKGARAPWPRGRLDPETGALGQAGISDCLEGAWLDQMSSGATYGVLVLDVEQFRSLEETLGRGPTNAVLPRLGAALRRNLRATDAIGRWGQDEILILLRLREAGDIFVVATRLKRALRDEVGVLCEGFAHQPDRMDIAFGVSVLEPGDDGPMDAIRRADHDLHLNKLDQLAAGEGALSRADFWFDPADDAPVAFRGDGDQQADRAA